MTEPTMLDRIVAQRREDVRAAKLATPFPDLQSMVRQAPPPSDFVQRLRAAAPVALLAEIKRASPSRGDIAPHINAPRQAMTYARAGAAAISVLTEPTWFKGTLEDLALSRQAVGQLGDSRPAVLRKDFVVDPYQVLEARAYGADAILLIVACLNDSELSGLMGFSREMGMEPLVEVNNVEEMQRAVTAGAALIGVNNRDLRSFDVDLGTTDRLAGMVPEGTILAALSGISSREDVERFERAGASAVLVGEALMLAPDPGAKVRELLGIHESRPTIHDSAASR
ncbi:MAG TPA: indole-3-glycerol phosphate synthase TrpC [Tepidiformaceae bacterium]|nr:indole-3-glycerol phosphate synthase TrpC [Tepidiformaceae bacterium]